MFLPNLKVAVLHNVNSVAMFLSPDQTLFITIKAIELAKNEKHLALMISHELGHYLLDHNVQRTFVAFFWAYIYRNIFRLASQKEVYDPVTEEFKRKTSL